MKNLILGILAKGYVKTKYTVSDICKDFYFIKEIIEVDERTGFIKCNNSKFWNPENSDNRTQLMHDIHAAGRGIRGKYSIYNRFENGDKYGIA